MLNFWENVSRYPRFFISASVGLVLIIISPFQKLFRTRSGVLLFILGLLGVTLFLSLTLKNMLDL